MAHIEGIAPAPRRSREYKQPKNFRVKYHSSNITGEYWEVGEGITVKARLQPGERFICFTCRSNNCEHIEALAEVWVPQDDDGDVEPEIIGELYGSPPVA